MADFLPQPQYTPPIDEENKRFVAQWTDWFARIEQYITLTGAYGGGVLPATAGGTGFGSYAVGDLLYASTTTVLARRAAVATGSALISGGVNTAPTWGKVGLTTHVSGVLPVANGGTGTATAFTSGSVVFAAAAGVYAQNNTNFFWDDTNSILKLGAVSATTETSPAQITANQNDYAALTAGTFALRINSDAARDITGLAGGAQGRIIMVTNVGAFAITLKDQNAGSTAANRFGFGLDIILGVDVSTLLRYDGTSSRWRAA